MKTAPATLIQWDDTITSMVIILSGPPGSGKSTVGEALALKFPQSASFSTDTIRQFIKGGNIAPWEVGEKAEKQMKLGDDIVQDIMKRYINSEYIVILDGIYGDEDIEKYKNLFGEVRGFLLLPSLDVLKERDSSREESKRVPHRIEPLHEHFSSKQHQLFETIDNSNQTVAETVDSIWKKLR
ncbi:MAG: AAA family ATPase [Patescibacteria group bacterium]